MDISQNKISDLLIWRKDLEDQITDENWEELHPLYSQVCFWINFKTREELRKGAKVAYN